MMNITKSLISLILIGNSIASFVPSAFAEDTVSFVGIKKSRTAKILDDFKDQQDRLLFEKAPFSAEEEMGLFDADKKIAGLNNLIERIENTKNQYVDQKAQYTKERMTLRAMLNQMDESIAETEKSIATTETAIAENTAKIAEYAEEIKTLQDKIAENKKAILEYLAYVYSRGDLMYGDDHQIDVLKTILLNDGNLSDILSDIQYKSLLEQAGQNFVGIHRDLVKQYYYNTETLAHEKIRNLKLKKELKDRHTELESSRAYKAELLAVTKGKEELFNRFIIEKQKREDELRSRVEDIAAEYQWTFETVALQHGCKFAKITKTDENASDIGPLVSGNKTECWNLKKFYDAEKNLRSHPLDVSESGNVFAWPVEPRYISSYFHDQSYFASVGSEHEAVDIPVAQWVDIVAPADGYVYFINPPTPGGYGYVALKHTDGYVTVYGHVSEILAERFDFIPAGKVFAKSGGTPGTPGAWVMTSGAHLHFEVHKDRESVDPLRFLDTTYLRYETLDSKYKFKYIQDLRARYGRSVNIGRYNNTFVLRGETEIDRQKYLLSTYAVGNFKNWDVWTEEAVSAKVDPSFLMCVGLAETGLGKNLKTAYNVGNVGNTDSGGTYEFESARDGIYWMTRTFNNTYLGKYESLDQLSRWGNKDGAIYASSSSNWHNNIVRCLSALKGRFIEDDYKFRLSPDEANDATAAATSGVSGSIGQNDTSPSTSDTNQ